MATTIVPTSRLLLSVSRGETRPDIPTTSALSEPGEAEGISAPEAAPDAADVSPRTPVFELLTEPFNPVETRLSIEQDKDSGRFVYRIISRETGEVLRQFPGEDVLRIARNLARGVGRVINEIA